MNCEIRQWISAWERAIRDKDFAAGELLFSDTASGFGTVTDRTRSRDELVQQQWRRVWPRTRNFAFDGEDLEIRLSADETMALAHARWTSEGDDDGAAPRARAGRCTLVLARDRRGEPWRCIHTHFSMWPQGGDTPLLEDRQA